MSPCFFYTHFKINPNREENMDNNEKNTHRFFGQDIPNRQKKQPIHEFVVHKLNKSNLQFESKFNNSYIIVKGLKGSIDFYPGTGAFTCKSTGARGRGIENLIKYAKNGTIPF